VTQPLSAAIIPFIRGTRNNMRLQGDIRSSTPERRDNPQSFSRIFSGRRVDRQQREGLPLGVLEFSTADLEPEIRNHSDSGSDTDSDTGSDLGSDSI
jgi:hypothetical protein